MCSCVWQTPRAQTLLGFTAATVLSSRLALRGRVVQYLCARARRWLSAAEHSAVPDRVLWSSVINLTTREPRWLFFGGALVYYDI